jgi:chaperonin GroEL
MTTARVRFGDTARAPLLAGCATFARLLAPTLGPLGRTVVIEQVLKPGSVEVLSTAALIARRTFRLPDPFENAGAMLLRHAVWRVYEETGDGTATTAVLAARLLRELHQLLIAGLAPTTLSRALDESETLVRHTLRSLARPVDDIRDLAGLLAPLDLSPDRTSEFLENLEALGPEGIVLVDPSERSEIHWELVQGVHWQSRLLAPELLPSSQARWQLVEPRIVLTDWTVSESEQLLPILEACARHRVRRLFIVAGQLEGQALALLAANLARGILEQVAAVAAPSVGLQQIRILEDLAALTGGRAIRHQAGERLEDARIGDLGSARQVTGTRWTFAILGGRGQRAAIQQRIALAEAELAAASDEDDRRRARERLARLHGTFLQVRVGAATPTERAYRLSMVERLARTIQIAQASGLLPGGGASFAVAARALADDGTSRSPEERAVFRAVRKALLEPLWTLVANAGRDPATVTTRALAVAPDLVYDVCADRWVEPWSARLLDPLGVLEAAVQTSWSLARSFLTTEVLVHRTWPASSAEP